MSVIVLGEHREQTLLAKLRSKQAEMVEVYKRKCDVQDIGDKLIDDIKATLSEDEWRDYGHRLDECWEAARHSDDDMSYAFAVLHEAIKTLEAKEGKRKCG
jgi:hypothetical protein